MAKGSTKVGTVPDMNDIDVSYATVVWSDCTSSTVSRIRAHSDMYEMDLLLDVNSDLYPIDVSRGTHISMLLVKAGLLGTSCA